jgi:hypothetical protein
MSFLLLENKSPAHQNHLPTATQKAYGKKGLDTIFIFGFFCPKNTTGCGFAEGRLLQIVADMV